MGKAQAKAYDNQDNYEKQRGKPMPTHTHGRIQALLVYELMKLYEPQMEVTSELTLNTKPKPTTPDLAIIKPRPLEYLDVPSKFMEAPLLTIEIQSPSQTTEEMVRKIRTYFDFGVRSAWIVVPEFQGVFVYSNKQDYQFFSKNETLKDENIDLTLDLSTIFR